jgi:hypothetical protein
MHGFVIFSSIVSEGTAGKTEKSNYFIFKNSVRTSQETLRLHNEDEIGQCC